MVSIIRRNPPPPPAAPEPPPTPSICLSRKVGQRIILTLPDGRRVEVEVVPNKGRRDLTRLRFTAPADVGVWREEIAPR